MSNRFRNLLGDFGASIGIPELELDEENRCTLGFDEVVVSFELGADAESIHLYAYLGDVVQANADALFSALLDANYCFKGTQGATLGRDEATGKVALDSLGKCIDLALVPVPVVG